MGDHTPEFDNKGRILVLVPFSGFYESVHSDEVDHVLERMFEDDSGHALKADAFNDAWEHIDYSALYEDYASGYTESLSYHLGVTLHFDELKSPREYNFTTDRIFAYVDRQDVINMFMQVDLRELIKLIRAKFTSRDGFMSYYSPDLRDWPKCVGDWDHNQLGAVLECLANQWARGEGFDEFDMWCEHRIMEDDYSNGYVDGLLWKHGSNKFKRLGNIANYLRKRQYRKGLN